jgi:hypothetical protein
LGLVLLPQGAFGMKLQLGTGLHGPHTVSAVGVHGPGLPIAQVAEQTAQAEDPLPRA